jgi:hypothetical protein
MDEADKNADDDRGVALDARDWIVRLTSGNVSDAELTRFKAWRERSPQHRLAFERERAFWQQLQGLEEPRGDVLPFRPPRRTAISRRAVLAGGGTAAAAGLAIVALPRMELWWNADFTTGVGDRAEVNLPDGSVAVLNTDSAIAVDFSPQMRLVKLFRGEAEFQVRRDEGSLFRVAALGGNSSRQGGGGPTPRRAWRQRADGLCRGRRAAAGGGGRHGNRACLAVRQGDFRGAAFRQRRGRTGALYAGADRDAAGRRRQRAGQRHLLHQ